MIMQQGGLLSFLKGFGYAFRGIFFVITSERNMKIHLFISVVVVAAAWFFQLNVVEWMVCLLCIAMVLAAEIINTAIENTIDLVSPDYHILARNAKDVAAGAVLVLAIFSAIIGCIIFVPKVIEYFSY
jgi:diacylglycerol kinase (ATP)